MNLSVLASRLLGLLLAAVALVALLAPRNTRFVFVAPGVWAVALLTLGLWWVGRGRVGRWGETVARRPRRAVAVGALVGAGIVVAHLPLTLIDFTWDASGVFLAAERLGQGLPVGEAGDYFARYRNNIPLLALETAAVRVGAAVGIGPLAAVLTVQTLGVVAILATLGSTLVRLGQHAAVWPVQGLAVVLVGLNPQVGVPYSDLPTAALVSLALWAGVRAWTGAGRAWWVLALAALVPAMALKLYAVALALGALVLLPQLVRRHGRRVAAVGAAVALVGLSAGVLTIQAVSARTTGLTDERLDTVERAVPVLHFVALGTHDTGADSPVRTYGGWSEDHVSRVREVQDPDARRAMLLQTIREQVGERGVAGNVSFFSRKIAWVWGDGTFFGHGEGNDRFADGVLDPPWRSVQPWFIGSGEPYQKVTATLLQGVWVATLLTTATGLLRAARPGPVTAVCALTLIVLTGYLTLFEARPRYLVALLPVLLLLTGLTSFRSQRTGSNTPLP